MSRMWTRFALLVSILTGCNNTVVVELPSGDQTFDISAAALGLPPELRDGTSGTIASIDCSVTGICPGTPDVTVTCTAGVCNPDPLTIALPVGDVVDFQAILAEASTLVRIVDEIQIARASYRVSPNGLTFDTPGTEILWGPETAVSVADATLLGTLPGIPAMATVPDGEMTIDAAGAAALSDHILTGSGRVRFFARTQVDLEPGAPFPDGMATATVSLRIRAIGRIID
jgi:hypothetical protein